MTAPEFAPGAPARPPHRGPRLETKAAPFLEANRRLMRETAARLAARLAEGSLSPAGWRRAMAAEVRAGAAAAFRFRLGRAATPDELAELNALLDRQAGFLDRFAAEAGNLSPEALAARAQLYSGAATQAEAAGALLAAPAQARISWHGPDGANSCDDCARYIGRSWSRAEFEALGVRPGATRCMGNCRCSLEVSAA